MRIICIITVILVSITSMDAFAWNDSDGSTHEIITDKAINISKFQNYFNNNLGLSIYKRIEGKIYEDSHWTPFDLFADSDSLVGCAFKRIFFEI